MLSSGATLVSRKSRTRIERDWKVGLGMRYGSSAGGGASSGTITGRASGGALAVHAVGDGDAARALQLAAQLDVRLVAVADDGGGQPARLDLHVAELLQLVVRRQRDPDADRRARPGEAQGDRHLPIASASTAPAASTEQRQRGADQKSSRAASRRSDHVARRGGRNGIGAPQTGQQPLVVGHLDGEAGACVELEQLRSAHGVDDDVDAEVAEAAHLGGAHGERQDVVPQRDREADDRCAGVDVMGDAIVVDGRVGGAAVADGDAGADGALMQVGAAVGFARSAAGTSP